jgi:hypothetical protein
LYAFIIYYSLQSYFRIQSKTIGSCGSNGIIGIGKTKNLGSQWDLFTNQSVGITGSVVPFMMIPNKIEMVL